MPDFAPHALLLRLTELNSIEAEIDMRKLLFLGHLVTEPKMAPSLRNLLRRLTESLFDKDVKSIGILPSIYKALNIKYDLFNYFEIWFNSSTFPTNGNWKSIVKNKVHDLESRLWLEFCSGHPGGGTPYLNIWGGLAQRSESKAPKYLSKKINIKKMLKSYPLNILKVQSESSKIGNLGQIFIFTENCIPNYPYESF